MAETPDNPYVGPRPFEAADRDRFFGRNAEIRQLASLIVARRVVVLYARSGAGKTSLLKAGLIPYLEERKRLQVLPVVRVRGGLPGELDPSAVANVYVQGALQVLLGDQVMGDQVVGDQIVGDQVGTRELPEMSLVEGLGQYLASVPEERAEVPRLLIIDQFEELFRTHPAFHRQRTDFFQQLARCLEEYPWLSLLLSLREDAVAELDPHAALLPDRLRTRFRLELLGPEAALEAMRRPALAAGLELPDSQARRLIDELRTLRVERRGGSREILGPHVEPVQLQVVCDRMWQQRTATGGRRPRSSRVQPVGSVDAALSDYYDQQVSEVAFLADTRERMVRDWLERHLITEHGFRGQVVRGVEDSQGLANEVVEALVEAHLVRSEKRRGATWYELAHDRLVEPVRASNSAWRRDHLHPMQHRAEQWARRGRPRGLLLSSRELRLELAWEQNLDDELTPVEQDFIAASRRARLTRRLGWLALLVTALLAGSLWLLTLEQEKRRLELARGLAAQARSRLDEQLDLALLLSLEAHKIDPHNAETRGSLLAALQYQPRLVSSLHGHQAAVWSLAFSARSDGGTVLASGGAGGQLVLWDADRRLRLHEIEAHESTILSLVFSPGGESLISTGRDRKVLLWDLSESPPAKRALRHDLMVTCATFDPRDERRLITGDTDGGVSIWDLSDEPPLRHPLGEHEGWVTSLAVDPSGNGLVASGGTDHVVRLWRQDRAPVATPVLSGHDGWISGLAWDPAGRFLASASFDGTVRRWSLEPAAGTTTLAEMSDRISELAISPDGKVLAAASANGRIYLWDTDDGRSLGPPLAGNLALMRGLAFSPDGRILAAGSGSAVLLWDVADPAGAAATLGSPLAGAGGPIRSVAFHSGGALVAVAAGGAAAEIRFLDAKRGEPRAEPLAFYPSATHDLAFSPHVDRDTLLDFAADKRFMAIRLWDWATGEVAAEVRKRIPSDIPTSISQDPDRRELLSQLGDFARVLEEALEPRRIVACEPVREVAYDSRGRALAAEAVAMPKSGVRVERWDVESGQSVSVMLEAPACVRSLAFSLDGDLLAVGTDEGFVVILTSADLGTWRQLEGHVLPVRGLAFSAGGRFLASGGDEGSVHVWDLDKTFGRPLALAGHTDAVLALAFDPRGQVLASAGRDRKIILWDVATGLAVGRPFTGHRLPVRSLAFSPDGERLLSGGDDGAWLWQLGFEAWRERACRIANRELTAEERERYLGNRDEGGESACPEIVRADD